MTSITAESPALEHAGGPADCQAARAPGRRVREAREKLTRRSSNYGFDIELLRLFAKGRWSSGPAMAGLA